MPLLQLYIDTIGVNAYGRFHNDLKLFFIKNNINLQGTYEKFNPNFNTNTHTNNQIGGSTFTATYKDVNYSFTYYNDTTDTTDTSDKLIIITRDKVNNDPSKENIKKNYCATLNYKTKDVLNVSLIEIYNDCYKSSTNEKNTGTILLKLIKLFAKKNGFKSILLEDEASYTCTDNQYLLSYKIKYVHTLTHGYPWYKKFGFNFTSEKTQKIMESNKAKLDKVKTKDYPLEFIIRLIITYVIDAKIHQIMEKYDYLESISQIIKIYDLYKENSFYSFMNAFAQNYCFILAYVYDKIYDSLGLIRYPTNQMIVYLNN
jgi:hypothetical protein